ncbi:hypothetical protein [Microcoleus sp. Z1_C4]
MCNLQQPILDLGFEILDENGTSKISNRSGNTSSHIPTSSIL